MMRLSEVMNQLSCGEFSQLSIGGNEAGVIDENNYTKVVAHINLGLIALYTRFPLKENRLVLLPRPGKDVYQLVSNYAASNTRSREPVRYILDSAGNPFKDDIAKIERVLTDEGVDLGLNNNNDVYSCHTPTLHSLRIPMDVADLSSDLPDWLKTDNLVVVYRALHAPIKVGIGLFDPERVELELPYTHLEALLYFVASRAHNPTGMTNEFHTGNSYYAKYVAACQTLDTENIKVDQGAQSDRLRRNGWV